MTLSWNMGAIWNSFPGFPWPGTMFWGNQLRKDLRSPWQILIEGYPHMPNVIQHMQEGDEIKSQLLSLSCFVWSMCKLKWFISDDITFILQEERRLFYVAMTRARKKLYITYVVVDSQRQVSAYTHLPIATSWKWWSQTKFDLFRCTQVLQPSRFLKELPHHLLSFQVRVLYPPTRWAHWLACHVGI